jgi:hypothetical protein
MLNTYIKNQGLSQTVIYNNNKKQKEFNEVNWNADYDGNQANISVTSNSNGDKKRYNVSLDNNDLANMLSVPSVNMPIDRRLDMDFNSPTFGNNPSILKIELPEIEDLINDMTDTASASLRPKVASLRPKVASLRPKVASLRPKVASLRPKVASSKLQSYLSSPLSNEEFIVPITIDDKTNDNYTFTPGKRHKHKKDHKTYKVYKKVKSSTSSRSKSSRHKKRKENRSFSLF